MKFLLNSTQAGTVWEERVSQQNKETKCIVFPNQNQNHCISYNVFTECTFVRQAVLVPRYTEMSKSGKLSVLLGNTF